MCLWKINCNRIFGGNYLNLNLGRWSGFGDIWGIWEYMGDGISNVSHFGFLLNVFLWGERGWEDCFSCLATDDWSWAPIAAEIQRVDEWIGTHLKRFFRWTVRFFSSAADRTWKIKKSKETTIYLKSFSDSVHWTSKLPFSLSFFFLRVFQPFLIRQTKGPCRSDFRTLRLWLLHSSHTHKNKKKGTSIYSTGYNIVMRQTPRRKQLWILHFPR